MQINRSNKTVNFFLGIIIIIYISSCYENVEGCLDPNSSNYDLTADIACEDCCTYPNLSLNVAFFNDDTAYNRIDSITNDLGVDIVVKEVQTYFSKISVGTGSEEFGISETLNYIDPNGDEQQVIDDIVLAKPSSFRYVLGSFAESNDYTQIKLSLGVPEEIDLAQSIEVTSDHPLAIAGDSLYLVDQNQYVKSWLILRQVGVHETADTLQINTSGYDYTFENLNIEQERGSSLDINIKIDYSILINGIDYNTMSKEEIINQIGENLNSAVQPNYE